ncbi:MAG: hypothetical protein IMZ61_00245 [Planctomycetes bacterium]|nr:hypothetical protein [Thermoplasmata archaeon]MBE3142347.1 hypothetical protein [Planctomycetota bacterium]
MNELQKLIAEYVRNNGKLSRVKSDRLLQLIDIKTDLKKLPGIIRDIYGTRGIKKEMADDLLSGIVKSVSVGAGVTFRGVTRVNSFKAWYTEHAYVPYGGKWGSRVNDLTRVGEITRDIRQSIQAGRSWSAAAQNLSDKGIQRADVAKDVQRIIDKARGVYGLTNDSEAYQAYKAEIAVVQRRINTLTRQDTSKLRRAYQDILDITNKSSVAQVESAIKYTAYFKQRYNAERIARTEMARAYGDAAFSDAIYNEDVIGIKFMLSSGHSISDICDLHCGADLFGMGPGVYPKEYAPEFPFHPSCLCACVKVFQGEADHATKDDYNPNGGKAYLNKFSSDEQRQILGASGRDAFKENPKAWESIMEKKGYNGQEVKKPTIPEEVLYGGK